MKYGINIVHGSSRFKKKYVLLGRGKDTSWEPLTSLGKLWISRITRENLSCRESDIVLV